MILRKRTEKWCATGQQIFLLKMYAFLKEEIPSAPEPVHGGPMHNLPLSKSGWPQEHLGRDVRYVFESQDRALSIPPIRDDLSHIFLP